MHAHTSPCQLQVRILAVLCQSVQNVKNKSIKLMHVVCMHAYFLVPYNITNTFYSYFSIRCPNSNTEGRLIRKTAVMTEQMSSSYFLLVWLLSLKATFYTHLSSHSHSELAAGRLAARWFNAINPSLEHDTACPTLCSPPIKFKSNQIQSCFKRNSLFSPHMAPAADTNHLHYDIVCSLRFKGVLPSLTNFFEGVRLSSMLPQRKWKNRKKTTDELAKMLSDTNVVKLIQWIYETRFVLGQNSHQLVRMSVRRNINISLSIINTSDTAGFI